MICYKCGNTLGSGRLCLHCGADVSIYRKIVRASNSYYNSALEKARVRDLSGALQDLNQSLQFDKNNIDARNLLGLIYYEMGEVVEALCQWVVSKNLQEENNLADHFLNEVQGNKNELDRMNKAIKDFNLSLTYASHDSEDLAVIQLRSVISQHPKMIKAYQLLVLLYMKDGEYSRANKLLKRILSLDRGNTFALKYTRELKGKITKRNKQQTYAEQQLAQQAADEVIVPKYSEKPKVLQLFLGLVLGIVICVCAYYFMLRPTMEMNTNDRWNQTAISYNEKLEAKDNTIRSLNEKVAALEKEVESLEKEAETYVGEDGSLTNYERMLTAMRQYADQDWANMAVTYASINPDAVDSSVFKECYDLLKNFVENDGMTDRLFESAKALIDQGKYNEAIPALESCLENNNNYEAAIYYMAFCYEAIGQDAEAAPYFKRIVDEFPDSQWYSIASSRVN